jgi:conjugal transfer pilus assembly protein TraK
MTALSPQDPSIMVIVPLTAGTALSSRLAARRVLCAALLGMSGLGAPAFADQNILVADNGTVHCDASLKDLTRITLDQDQFASVSKVQATNPADDFEVVNEPTRGDIYLSVGQGFSKGSIAFFGTTRKGYVYKFLCTVAGAEAKQVFVANADLVHPRAVGEQFPAGLSPQDEAARLIAALYAQTPVEGYDIDWHPLAPVTTRALTVQRVGQYRGAALTAKLIKLTNNGSKPVDLREDDVGPADAIAISLSRSKLDPGEATTAFVVVTHQAGGARP